MVLSKLLNIRNPVLQPCFIICLCPSFLSRYPPTHLQLSMSGLDFIRKNTTAWLTVFFMDCLCDKEQCALHHLALRSVFTCILLTRYLNFPPVASPPG